MTESIGFIGLGLMGTGFTERLVARGRRVVGYDIDAAKREAAAGRGVVAAGSPAEVAGACEVVLVCVTTTKAVEQVVLGEGGVAEAKGHGGVLVDHSTTEIAVTKRLAAELQRRDGMRFVDAPVSGGPPAAREGRLAIMAGGEAAAIARVRPIMDDVAGRFTHMGEVGAGQATKLVNQVLVLTQYCVLAEALVLGERFGVDVARIPEALAGGHAGSNMLRDVFPQMLARDFAPRGFARQVLKDLHLLQDTARDLTLPMPMSSTAAMLFRLLVGRGHGEQDATAVLRLYLDEPV